ncbi:MAG TPA: 6-phosphogluconolactonase, partial [Gemmatimonadales bacterium]|nr:6-phosphogluconolactonase [Gemmatimonadales bacterium]
MSTLEKIRTEIAADHDDVGRRAAHRIAEVIRARRGRAVLGLATGATVIGVYRELIRMHREEGLSFAGVVTFNLDEYTPMDPGSIHSYHRFMQENLFAHVDLDPANIHVPRGDLPAAELEAECARYEAAIAAAGGIDLQLLGIGRTGHIG